MVKGILDLPVLWVGLDLATGAPRLVGNLNLSHMKMVPKDGMDNRVTIEVFDANGGLVDRDSIKLDTDIFEKEYGIEYELKKCDPGKTYTVKASADLGVFLGSAEFEDEIDIPARR